MTKCLSACILQTMRFSVVIPTYNRSEKLKNCLQALFTQNYDKRKFEIIVVDDGSQDETRQFLQRVQKKSPVPLYSFFQPNQGQASARNKGITEAKGEIILFIGDDIESSPDMLKEHDRTHTLHPEDNSAVLGFITWHPSLNVTPLMKFMERGGAIFGKFGGNQFAFDLLKGKETADFHFFYTSNISLKRRLLEKFKFDPWFSGYGWEDIELGYRLAKNAGLTIHYNPAARAYHDHPVTYEQWEARMHNIGRSSILMQKKYPELNVVPKGKKLLALKILSSPPSLFMAKLLSKNLYFYGLSKKYFLKGTKECKM